MQDEVFNHGSFLQSRMFAKGVTCSNCHEPHSQKLRAEGNALCGQCHEPARFDSAQHFFHAPGSKAGACVTCHMPVVTYMIVDPRHDHSFRIPRPDLAATLGSPDVCTTCHTDKSAAWAAGEIRARTGQAPAGFQTFGEAFAGADRGDPSATVAAWPHRRRPDATRDREGERDRPADRARPHARPRRNEASPVGSRMRPCAPPPSGRWPAPTPTTRLDALPALLRDPVREVRLEAARALAGDAELRLAAADRDAFRRALDEYIAVQRYNADRAEGHMNLALLELRRGNTLLADDHLARAIAVDPSFMPAYVQQADLYRARREDDKADAILRRAVEREPDSAMARHALGLSLIRQRRLEAALEQLRRASELEPTSARYGYVYAVALQSAGRPQEASRVADEVLGRSPYDADTLIAAATWANQRGDVAATLRYLTTLRLVRPDDRAIGAEIERLRRAPTGR